MCGIDWCGFTWQAFATLATGFAAVGGATFIGVRQHGLVREQAQIAKRQADTAEASAIVAKLKLRADLFERRLEVFHAIHAYLKSALSSDLEKIWDATPELDRQLVRAKFLFSNEITSQLEAAIDDSNELNDKKYQKSEAREAGEETAELLKEIRQLRKNLRTRISDLADTLGDEMKLYGDR